MSNNRLAEETSPYLKQHKDNPVHWYAWGQDALQEAETSGKPILLSIGYAACHWCHVMNSESFSDAETASLMNEKFINVKLDREQRPDIDRFYQAAAQMMGYRGGWPLTIFLNAKGEPYFVGGYFPKEEQEGQPAFKTVLNDVANLYQDQSETVAANAAKITEALNEQWSRDTRGQLDPRSLDIMAVHTAHRFDIFYGGMTGAPKFPHAPTVEVLWRGFLRTGAQPFAQLVQTSLDTMCLSSLYDHVGGGFHRYCVDERWLFPHFEKMSAENAVLVDLLTMVAQFNKHPLYRTRIEETLNWLSRDMKVQDAFATSLDADSDGKEGAYYLWDEADVDAALSGTFSQRFKEVYNVRKEGLFNGSNVLQRLGAPFPLNDADEALLLRQRELLLAARQTRTAPQRDDQVLADVNGLIIYSFANASAVYSNPEWLRIAMKAFEFVVKTMSDGDRLYHSWCEGKRGNTGFADDYAAMARAAFKLWEVTSNKRYLELAQGWVRVMNELFWDDANGGYFQTAADNVAHLARIRTIFDQATPCANALMLELLAKLYAVTGEEIYQQRVNATIGGFARELNAGFIGMGGYLNGLETLIASLQIVIIGAKESGKTQELIAAVLGRSLPNATLVVVDPAETLPASHPAFGKTMENGQPTAYICQHKQCMAPITNAVTLAQILQLPARPQTPAGRA